MGETDLKWLENVGLASRPRRNEIALFARLPRKDGKGGIEIVNCDYQRQRVECEFDRKSEWVVTKHGVSFPHATHRWKQRVTGWGFYSDGELLFFNRRRRGGTPVEESDYFHLPKGTRIWPVDGYTCCLALWERVKEYFGPWAASMTTGYTEGGDDE